MHSLASRPPLTAGPSRLLAAYAALDPRASKDKVRASWSAVEGGVCSNRYLAHRAMLLGSVEIMHEGPRVKE